MMQCNIYVGCSSLRLQLSRPLSWLCRALPHRHCGCPIALQYRANNKHHTASVSHLQISSQEHVRTSFRPTFQGAQMTTKHLFIMMTASVKMCFLGNTTPQPRYIRRKTGPREDRRSGRGGQHHRRRRKGLRHRKRGSRVAGPVRRLRDPPVRGRELQPYGRRQHPAAPDLQLPRHRCHASLLVGVGVAWSCGVEVGCSRVSSATRRNCLVRA